MRIDPRPRSVRPQNLRAVRGADGCGGGAPAQLPANAVLWWLLSVLFNRGNVAVVFPMVSLNLVNAFYLQTQADQVGLFSGTARLETILEFVTSALSLRCGRPESSAIQRPRLMCWAFPSVLGITFVPSDAQQCRGVQAIVAGPMRTLQWASTSTLLARATASCRRPVLHNNVVIALVSDNIPLRSRRISTTTPRTRWKSCDTGTSACC